MTERQLLCDPSHNSLLKAAPVPKVPLLLPCALCCLFRSSERGGFLRLATNPAVFGEEAVTVSEAWILYDALLADERVYYLPEPHGLEPCWRKFTEGGTYSPKVWSDAYLAAFALVSGIALVSFDEGFQKFDGLKWTIPDVAS
jgi:hypothetical protein